MGILDGIVKPSDVKNLNIKQMETLAEELRGEILGTIEKNGGHLASNLGIVETTIALYNAFDFDKDKLIFDVGHQCYAHKILSGRKEEFHSIRTNGGLSGFPDREESAFDAFTVGHAGTSIAAGIGYCAARDKNNEDYFVINVVGDGSIANGLNLEALVSSNVKPKNYIVILNDNGMSISKNKNGFYQFVSKGTTKRGYIRSKRALRKIFGNSFITKGLAGVRNFIKRILNKPSQTNYFENHGFKYVGLVDGNNIKELSAILKRVKVVAREKAILLHIKTTKGKGYKDAEEHADVYHGVGKSLKCESGNFSVALGGKLNELIEKDPKITAITAAMKDGTGLSIVEENHPQNFVDVGIAEEYAVTLAAGMAAGGLKPVVAVYSTFMQRAYDQIIHDVCLQNLPVVLCLDRAGLVGMDGKTHQGVFDLSYLCHIPNLSVFAPNTVEELGNILEYAFKLNSPVAIRYPKNAMLTDNICAPIEDEPWQRVKSGDKITLLAVGPNMLKTALTCSEKCEGVGVISVRRIKPLCEKTLKAIKDTVVITLEENSVIGGFGSYVCAYYQNNGFNTKVKTLGVKDGFVSHGTVDKQLKENGLTEEELFSVIEKLKVSVENE